MERLDPTLVTEVAEFFKGKRRELFLASVAIINDSLTLGAWSISRGSIKADMGFNRGLSSSKKVHDSHTYFKFYMCLVYGRPCPGDITDEMLHQVCPTLPAGIVRSWVALCGQKADAAKLLDSARPLPVITAIGLSPKVTMTLKECSLDIDLPTIKMAKLVKEEAMVRARDKNHVPLFNEDGSPKMSKIVWYRVEWTPGIKHNQSRFVSGCQACGKRIPSGRYVPIEAECRKNGLISMWIGCDCARNIFGIKDVGTTKTAEG